jgi:hypothetical protein
MLSRLQVANLRGSPVTCLHIDPNPPFVGVQVNDKYEPILALYNCRACGSTLSIPWAETTVAQRIEAGLAQMTVDARSEMTCR